jgi:hypothetical protein
MLDYGNESSWDSIALQHQEWYMVSKGGKSCYIPMWIIINGFALLEKNLEIMY